MKKQKTIELDGVTYTIKQSVPHGTGYTDLNDVYNSPSNAKRLALKGCRRMYDKHTLIRDEEGNGYRIQERYPGSFHGVYYHNCQTFTVSYEWVKEGYKYYAYITAYHNYIEIEKVNNHD